MPKRGRKRKLKLRIHSDTAKSILSVVLLVLAAISAVSFFVPDYKINAQIQELLKDSFGFSSVIIPAIFGIWGLLFVKSIKVKIVQLNVLLGLVGLLIASSGLFAVVRDVDGGGGAGVYVKNVLSGLVSVYGAIVIFAAGIIISAILMLDVSFDDIAQKALEGLKRAQSDKKPKGDAKKADVKISVGAAVMDKQDWDSDKETEEAKEEVEASYEIIPSISEPLGYAAEALITQDSDVVSISPNLPYADKVWETPPLDLLPDPATAPADRGNVKARAKIIEDTLKSFGIDASVADINYGPSVTQYALETSSGTKIAKISSLQYDLALALASPTGSVRIEAPIPGKSLIGIEVPNNTTVNVSFKEALISDAMKGMKSKLGIVLGKDVGGKVRVYDISKMPHMLVAGATGSGKSVFLHSILFSLLFRNSPAECKFILIDLKRVELVHYADIPHLYAPVITDHDKAASVFRWAVAEMERRYKLFETAKVRNIDGYNEKSGFQALPYIVIVVDELAEIMVSDPASVEKSIIRIAQLARATGIHLILTVQRPSTNVITGLIKANIPCRAAFNVASQVDSRVIIDQPGAEKLMGKGDMLFVPPDASKPIRIQGSMISDREISQLVGYLRNVGFGPEYKDEILKSSEPQRSVSAGGMTTDSLFSEATDVVVTAGKASASLLQRRLSVGYARAARILDELEAQGVIGPAQGSRPRDILVGKTQIPPEPVGGGFE